MKKIILTAFAALMALAVFTGCEYNAIDEKPLPVEWTSSYTVSNDVVAKAKEGAVLEIKIAPKNNASNIQVLVVSNYWNERESQFYKDGSLVKNDGSCTELYYTVSSRMAAAVKSEGGMLLVGSGYIVKSVSISKEAPANPLESELENVKKELEEIKNGSSSEKKQPTIKTVSSIEIKKNEDGSNNQAVIEFLAESNEYVAKKGDVLTFTIKGTPDGDVSELKAFVVDNSKGGNWWTLLTDYASVGKLTKGEETTITVTAEVKKDASSKEPAACKLALFFDPMQDDAVTFTVSSFYMEVK